MKRRLVLCAALAALLLVTSAAAQVRWTETSPLVRPGKWVRFTLETDAAYPDVELITADGTSLGAVTDALPQDGVLAFPWDGSIGGADVSPGAYTLRAYDGDGYADTPVAIGKPAPTVTLLYSDDVIGETWMAECELNMAGTLRVALTGDGLSAVIFEEEAEAGEMEISWDGTVGGEPLPPGSYELAFQLIDATGFASETQSISAEVEETPEPQGAHDESIHTPNEWSVHLCDHDLCYWKLPIDIRNEAAVWEVLTQPITVLKGDQRKQFRVRAEPDEACEVYTGVVTYDSQAVHILEKRDDWTLIGAYSSSVEGSKVKVWAEPFEGWVPTSLLQEKQVNQELGIVIDKLQQKLYVFREGRLFTTLLCSTGFPRSYTPFHETPAGEFIVCSRTGGFWANGLYCDMGMRINDGILMHEVPCRIIEAEDGTKSRDYSRCERFLGDKASHGCIRIQKELTPEGVNMKWLWNNVTVGTKVIIWDELDRTLLPPDDDFVLYYNPAGGKQYHSSPTCRIVLQDYWPLKPFLYSELDEKPYARLTRCPGCCPEPRPDGIDTINEKNTRVLKHH